MPENRVAHSLNSASSPVKNLQFLAPLRKCSYKASQRPPPLPPPPLSQFMYWPQGILAVLSPAPGRQHSGFKQSQLLDNSLIAFILLCFSFLPE